MRYVEDSVANVLQNLAIGAVLATLVIYLFLRSAGATLVAVIGIPICTLAAFLGLLSAGRTINVISLAGIAFAIGMTVDDTIVVLESIDENLCQHARTAGLQPHGNDGHRRSTERRAHSAARRRAVAVRER